MLKEWIYSLCGEMIDIDSVTNNFYDIADRVDNPGMSL